MKLQAPINLKAAAEILDCAFKGDPEHLIQGINEIHCVVSGDLTFVDVEKYYEKALSSAASTILLNKDMEAPEGKGLLISEDPFNDFNRLTSHFQPRKAQDTAFDYLFDDSIRIGRGVVFGENVTIGLGAEIGHNTVIGSNVTIGANTILFPNVSILNNVRIGANCTIQSGVVIGGEAFYYKTEADSKSKLLTKGRVIIEDHVDIGANTTIDAGVTDLTRVGEYTKIDNLCQIGHDTLIGKRCIIAAQVGIAGVVKIGNDCFLWGQVGITPKQSIGDNVILYGKTGVMHDLSGDQSYGGMIADTSRNFLRKENALKRLIEIMPEIEQLIKK